MPSRSHLTCPWFLAVVLTAGIAHAQTPVAGDTTPPVHAAPDFSVYVYRCVFDQYVGRFDELATDLVDLGIVRIRLSTSATQLASDPTYVQDIRDCNREMHAAGIEVWALYLQTYTLLQDPAKVAARTNTLVDYHEGLLGAVAIDERFDGLDLDVEPVQHPDWGLGWPARDGLVRDLIQNVVAVVRSNLDARMGAASVELPFSVAVNHFLHDRVLDGSLTRGRVNHFLNAGANVVSLFDYDDDADDLIRRAEVEVAAAKFPNSVEIVIKTRNTGTDDESFYQEGCLALVATMTEVMASLEAIAPGRLVPAVSVFEYDSFQEICGGNPPLCSR